MQEKCSVDHLSPRAKSVLSLPDEQRIEYIRKDAWVGYSRATEVLAKMEEIFSHPRVTRPRGMLLIGGTNQGKTTLLKRFCSKHPVVDRPAGEGMEIPVLRVQCPPGPDESRFYNALLKALGAPFKFKSSPDEKLHQLITIFPLVGTRMLLLDEIHNTLNGPMGRKRIFLDALRGLGNELCIPIIAAGIRDAHSTISTDPQLMSRLPLELLPPWQDGEEFWNFLFSFERLLPLRKPSHLKSEAISSAILHLSEGILGEAVTILTQAACKAVTDGDERITLKLIRSLRFVRPSRRRTLTGSNTEDGGVLGFTDDPLPQAAPELLDAEALPG